MLHSPLLIKKSDLVYQNFLFVEFFIKKYTINLLDRVLQSTLWVWDKNIVETAWFSLQIVTFNSVNVKTALTNTTQLNKQFVVCGAVLLLLL